VKPDIEQYLAIERPCQHASLLHPEGITLQAQSFVEAFDRGQLARSSRFSSPCIQEGDVAILIGSGFGPL
jgi:hypothetical protein